MKLQLHFNDLPRCGNDLAGRDSVLRLKQGGTFGESLRCGGRGFGLAVREKPRENLVFPTTVFGNLMCLNNFFLSCSPPGLPAVPVRPAPPAREPLRPVHRRGLLPCRGGGGAGGNGGGWRRGLRGPGLAVPGGGGRVLREGVPRRRRRGREVGADSGPELQHVQGEKAYDSSSDRKGMHFRFILLEGPLQRFRRLGSFPLGPEE